MYFSGHFDDPGGAVMQYSAHPMEKVHGCTGSHWMPPLGEFLPRIAPADAVVINFSIKN